MTNTVHILQVTAASCPVSMPYKLDYILASFMTQHSQAELILAPCGNTLHL